LKLVDVDSGSCNFEVLIRRSGVAMTGETTHYAESFWVC